MDEPLTADQRKQKLKEYGQDLVTAYRFKVEIDKEAFGAFTECTLPAIELDVEEVKEGGLNSYVHQLPGARRPARITLKNGVGLPKKLLKLYCQALDGGLKRMTVTITLLNSNLNPVLVIHAQNAYPVKWSGPDLRSDGNAIAIQSLELICGEVKIGE